MISKKLLYDTAKMYDIELDTIALDRFNKYSELLVRWNKKFNLTAITEPDEIVIKHFIDSIICLTTINVSREAKLVDIGTGAGFPSIPMLIARPDLRCTLLDSNNKKVSFLNAVITELDLDAEIKHVRAEDLGKDKNYREQYDISTARAVTHLRELSEYCIPFLKVGGIFIAMKGMTIKQELDDSKQAIKVLGGIVKDKKVVKLPNDNTRNLVIIEKISQTPTVYPRPSAKIAKNPIK